MSQGIARIIVVVLVFAGLAACSNTDQNVQRVTATRFVAGSKNSFYEVVSDKELRLAPGVRLVPVKGPIGGCGAFAVMRENTSGGYISCGCTGAQTSSCKTENDNPDHFLCTGGCSDSEGNPHSCEGMTFPGPPRDPYVFSLEAAIQ
jgi:hypothetical protein